MATKNLVPRATGEGQIGLSSKKWSQANFVTGNFDSLTVSGQSITGTLTVNGQSITGTIAGLSDTNITNPSSAQILVHDGTNSFDNVTLSGDATLSSAGVLTISDAAVTNAMLEGSIANSKLANSSVTINSNSLSLGGSLTLDTGDIGEGSNLYYTDERVDDRVNTLLTEGTGITLTYDDNANSLTIDASVSSNINSLTDVSITNVASNQLLQYNGSNWVNVKSSHLMVAPVVVTTAGDITTDNNNNRYKTYANNHYVYTNSGVTDDIVYWSLPGVNGHNVTPVSGDTIVIENMTSNTIRIVGRVTAGYVIERNTTLGQANGSLTTNIGPGTQVIIRYVPTSSGSLGNNGKWLLSWMPNAEIINPSNSTDATAFENSPIVWDKYTLGSDDFGRWVPQGMSSHDLQVRGYNSNVGELKLYKANNANYTSLKSTSSISSNRELTLPDETGTLATQTYVQNYVQGLDVKESVRVATTTGGTLSSSFENGDTIDGVALATGDRILIKDQAMDETQNGIYIVNASGAPTRADDLAAGSSSAGCFTFVEEGTTNGDKGFVCTANSGSDVVGTHSISFTTFSSAGSALTDIVNDTSPQLGGNLDVNSRDIVSASNGNITLTPNGTGVVRIDGTNGVDIQSGEISVKNSGSVSNIKLYCESSNAHYTQLQSAAHSAYSGNVTLTLPASDGILVGSGDTGTVTNAMLAGSIVDSKLNTITTANKISLSALDLDGGTDIGADLVDADLIVVDDGAGGTNRKSALSRIKKYVYSAISGDATASDAGALTIASGAVETAMVNANVITGQTAETSIANDDLVLIYDTSESALRKMTKANFVSGLGGGGLANVVEDTTPELGGDLECLDNSVKFGGSSGAGWAEIKATTIGNVNALTFSMDSSVLNNSGDNSPEPAYIFESSSTSSTSTGPQIMLFNKKNIPAGGELAILDFKNNLGSGTTDYLFSRFGSRKQTNSNVAGSRTADFFFEVFSNGTKVEALKIAGSTSDQNVVTTINKFLDVTDHDGTTGLKLGGTLVTATADELNLVDGSSAGTIVNSKAVIYGSSGEVNATTLQIAGTSITSTAAELNKLDGATVTATELNVIDGDTSATSTTLVDADRVVVNDDGTMKQVAMTDVMTYVNANVSSSGISNIVEDTTPQLGGNLDLNSQSITGHLKPSASETYSLGTTGLQWSELHLKEDATIYFGTGSGTSQKSLITNNNSEGFTFKIGYESDGEPIFRIKSLSNTNEPGPTLALWCEGDNANSGGKLSFRARSGSTAEQEYVTLTSVINNNTSGSRASSLEFRHMTDNATVKTMEIIGNDSNANTITKIYKILDIADHDTGSIGLRLAGTNVTAIAAELNLVDGSSAGTIVNSKAVVYGSSGEVNATTLQIAGTSITSTAAELNKLDGATVTTTELNVIDGDTSATSTTLVDADRVVVNDDGTMKQVAMTDVMTYVNANVSGGGGGGGFTYSAITSTTTAQAEYHYSVDTSGGAVTLNLPARSGVTAGKEIRVKLATAGNDLTIDGNSTETIDGSQTLVLNVVNQSVTLVAGSSTNWEIV